jgi:tRNA(Ile)-lysidine synthase
LLEGLGRRCRFPAAGTPVTCAVSGGADSLALLVLAAEAGCTVTAVHVDHGLRAGSATEADIVAAAAARFGAGFRRERVVVGAGPNVEARARAARYAVLPDDVLTGHTADDQAETVLLNLLRGAGLDGTAGMRVAQRPLLGLRRTETRALCASLGLDPIDDPMNADPTLRRTRVRHELLPLLADVAGRDIVPLLARHAEVTRVDTDLLHELAAALDPTDARTLAAAPLALARRAVREWLRPLGGVERHPPDLATVDRVLDVARGGALATEVGGGYRVTRSGQRLRLERP